MRTKTIRILSPKEIAAMRRRLGVSQGRLAAKIGVSTSAVASWEHGTRSPKPVHMWLLWRIAEATKQGIKVRV